MILSGSVDVHVIVALSFTVTVTLMISLCPVARILGLVDRPGGRKMHLGHVPLTGGIAMTAGMLAGAIAILPLSVQQGWFAVSICLLALVGALDDKFDLPKSVRIVAQTIASLIMIYGAKVAAYDLGRPFLGGLVELGSLSPLFTVLIVLTAINALNIFDGSNGVAGGQSLAALLLLGAVTIVSGGSRLLPMIACLSACVVGFLLFNWPARATAKRRAFMGDAGSTVLGFSLAWLSLSLSQGDTRAFSPVCALWVFSLPLYDLFSSIVRRISSGRSPFTADADHLHHLLRRSLGSAGAVASVIVLAAGVFGSVGLYAHYSGVQDGVLFIGWLLTGGLYYIVFGSGLVVKRRGEARPPLTAVTESGGLAATSQAP